MSLVTDMCVCVCVDVCVDREVVTDETEVFR